MTGLASWLEAWNQFAGVIVATKPARALEMLRYQTLITTAFQDYPAEACIEYDCRFRQLAAKDKKFPWDKYKEDIFVWCFSPKPASAGLGNATETHNYCRYSKPAILSRLGPATDTITHTSTEAKICIHALSPNSGQCESLTLPQISGVVKCDYLLKWAAAWKGTY